MAGTLKLTNIKFHAGAGPGKPPLETQPGTVVIFVGPNNSGKSLALREIENWCFGKDSKRHLVDNINVDFPDNPADAESLMRQFQSTPPPNNVEAPGHMWVGQYTFRSENPTRQFQFEIQQLKNMLPQKGTNPTLREWLTGSYTIRLDGRTRFSLSDAKQVGDLQRNPENHLWSLFLNDKPREEVRRLTNDAFGLHFVIDPTLLGQLRIRMSTRPPVTKNGRTGAR